MCLWTIRVENVCGVLESLTDISDEQRDLMSANFVEFMSYRQLYMSSDEQIVDMDRAINRVRTSTTP